MTWYQPFAQQQNHPLKNSVPFLLHHWRDVLPARDAHRSVDERIVVIVTIMMMIVIIIKGKNRFRNM